MDVILHNNYVRKKDEVQLSLQKPKQFSAYLLLLLMRPTFPQTVKIILLIVAVSSAAYFWLTTRDLDAKITRRFHEEVQIAKNSAIGLDLRNFDPIDWDELVFWGPYANLCDLGIIGYERSHSQHCEDNSDDTQCSLLFVKQNRLVARVRIDRKQIDWPTSLLPVRIKREVSHFKFLSSQDWPKISWAEDAK